MALFEEYNWSVDVSCERLRVVIPARSIAFSFVPVWFSEICISDPISDPIRSNQENFWDMEKRFESGEVVEETVDLGRVSEWKLDGREGWVWHVRRMFMDAWSDPKQSAYTHSLDICRIGDDTFYKKMHMRMYG